MIKCVDFAPVNWKKIIDQKKWVNWTKLGGKKKKKKKKKKKLKKKKKIKNFSKFF